LSADAFENAKAFLFPCPDERPRSRAQFDCLLEQARQRLPGLVSSISDRIEAVLKSRAAFLQKNPVRPPATQPKKLVDLKQLSVGQAAPPSPLHLELGRLVPRHFLRTTPFERLPDLVRYLRAFSIRAERAPLNPAKDAERAAQLHPYTEALSRLEAQLDPSPARQNLVQELKWMVEEFRVSLFAQEVGTAIPVSPKRLDEKLRSLGS